MPFYEYQCSACGHHVEILQKISDAPLRKCPECGKQKLARLISAPVFRLKGSGWYETDFKSDKENKRNLVDSGGESKDSGVDGAKPPEPKPAEAKEATKPAADKPAASSSRKAKAASPKAKPKVAARKKSGKR